MTTLHTPTPWRTDPETENESVLGPDGYLVADCCIFSFADNAPTSDLCEANATFIVKAVNCHDELIAALRHARSELKGDWCDTDEEFAEQRKIKIIDAALAKAGAL